MSFVKSVTIFAAMMMVASVGYAKYGPDEVDLWTVTEGSPKVSKITIIRKYDRELRENHPDDYALVAWWAPDGACLAWGYRSASNSHYRGSDEWHTHISGDTVQADYSATEMITYPNFENISTGLKYRHFAEKGRTPYDKWGNWTRANVSFYLDSDHYIERVIEYAGSESEATKAEIEHFQKIRTSGTQKAEDRLTAMQRYEIQQQESERRTNRILEPLKFLLALVCGLYTWLKYRKWKKGYYVDSIYNHYSALPYLSSALAIWLTNGLYAILLPAINRMLIHDRRLDTTTTTFMTLFNVAALGFALNDWLYPDMWYFGTFVAIMASMFVFIYFAKTQVYKCPKCRSLYTSFVGITDGGVIRDNSQDHSSDVSVEGNTIVKTDTYRNRNDYYQRDIHNYKCKECGATWYRRFKGRYLGSDKLVETKTKRVRID